jgi:CDP-glucose 4,6-dehydratase
VGFRASPLEGLEVNFWNKKRVFITGHTGFKGSWLSLWLNYLGAEVTGYALNPPTDPSLFDLCDIDGIIDSIIADIRDQKKLIETMTSIEPEIVIHMAAQPLVRESYNDPVETFDINVLGTVNLFEAVRRSKSVRAVVNVTTDKCYENKDTLKAYKETDPLGGFDPYSTSKACSELATASYRSSFFNPKDFKSHSVAIATARAGNVIGGGDWADDRLVPDFVRSILSNQEIKIRNPKAIRPWQHVLEPLSGYLMLAEKLYKHGPKYSEAWNFGPDRKDAISVEWIIKKLCEKWGEEASYKIDQGKHPHEAHYLILDHSKATSKLGWKPKWGLETALDKIVGWTKAYKDHEDVTEVCLGQIKEYLYNGRKGEKIERK